MVYLAGIIGLICGFVLGQGALILMLRRYTNEELLKKRKELWFYGLLNWIIAGLCSYSSVKLYEHFFDSPGF